MAKKKQAGRVNKSAKIRDYLKSHPNEKPSEVAAALKKQGLDVDAQYVSVVKSSAKTKRRSPKKSQPKTQPRKSKPELISIDSIVKAKRFVVEVGDMDEARQALDALARLVE